MEFPRWFQRLWIRAAAGSTVLLTALNGLTQNTTSTPPVTTAPTSTLDAYDQCTIRCMTEHVQSYNKTHTVAPSNCTQQCTPPTPNNTRISSTTTAATTLTSLSHTTANQEEEGSGLGLGLGLAVLGVGVGAGCAIAIYKHCRDRHAHREEDDFLLENIEIENIGELDNNGDSHSAFYIDVTDAV